MASFFSKNKQDVAIQNFIDNLSDIDDCDESDDFSSDEGILFVIMYYFASDCI